jgi:hypothetical protein
MTHVFWVIQNKKSGSGSIEHLGKTFFSGAMGHDPVTGHLSKEKQGMVRAFQGKNQIPTQSYVSYDSYLAS